MFWYIIMDCFWWVVIYSVYVLCPNCQNTCQTNSLHWNTGCGTCVTLRLIYDYGQMVSGWMNNYNEVNTNIRTHKSKWHQVTQTKSSFLFFPFCRWMICLVRNRSLNLRIFVFRSGYSRKRVKRLQNLQKEHTPKQLGTWSLFLSPSGLAL